jgi:hypothetical protein
VSHNPLDITFLTESPARRPTIICRQRYDLQLLLPSTEKMAKFILNALKKRAMIERADMIEWSALFCFQ